MSLVVCFTEGKELWTEAEMARVDEPTGPSLCCFFSDMKRVVL